MANGMSDTPKQVTFPGDASKPFVTDKDGVVYPDEISRPASEFLAGEGSMGFERNQQVKRDTWKAPEAQGGTMGQKKLQKIKTAGSHAI